MLVIKKELEFLITKKKIWVELLKFGVKVSKGG